MLTILGPPPIFCPNGGFVPGGPFSSGGGMLFIFGGPIIPGGPKGGGPEPIILLGGPELGGIPGGPMGGPFQLGPLKFGGPPKPLGGGFLGGPPLPNIGGGGPPRPRNGGGGPTGPNPLPLNLGISPLGPIGGPGLGHPGGGTPLPLKKKIRSCSTAKKKNTLSNLTISDMVIKLFFLYLHHNIINIFLNIKTVKNMR